MPWRALLLLLAVLLASAPKAQAEDRHMFLQSPDFADGATLPVSATCAQQGLSPALRWGGLPEQTRGLALAVTDPDAPSGVFTHWLVWGLPPQAASLLAGVTAAAAGLSQRQNDFGRPGYGPACPPPASGVHRYVFTLYALDGQPDLRERAGQDGFARAIAGHVLQTATLTGLYARR